MRGGTARTGEATRGRPGILRSLAPVDALHILVCLLLLLACPLALRRTEAGWWLPAGFAALGIAIAVLARADAAGAGPVVRIAHFWYPLLAVPLVFWSLYWIVPAVSTGGYHVAALHAWDQRLLGFDPVEWHRKIESPFLTDVMHLLYLSYFFLPVLLIVRLLPSGRREALSESIFVLCLAFFACYAGYLLVPAKGPRFYVFGSNEMEGWILTQPLRDLIDTLEPSKADAFPSAHAALTLTVAVLALRHDPRLGRWMVPLSVGILASLAYARYHYVVDVIAGALFAAAALVLGPILCSLWNRLRGIDPAGGAE